MTGLDYGDLLIQVTAWTIFTVYRPDFTRTTKKWKSAKSEVLNIL